MLINLKKYLIPILITLTMLFNIFVLNIYRINNWLAPLLWILLAVLSYFVYGKKNRINSKSIDVIQLVFIYCMIYELLTYLSGLFLGFVKSPYSIQPITIIKNLSSPAIILFCQEFIRSSFIARYHNKRKSIIIITIVFIAYEIGVGSSAYNLKDTLEWLKMLTVLVAGSITKNILCSYMTYKTDFKPSILYRAIFELVIYVVPIFPNLGDYIEAVVSMLFPILLLTSIFAIYEKKKFRTPKKSVTEIIILWLPCVAIILCILAFQTGIFRYRSMAIGSQSMYPNINKGDVIIVDQYKKTEQLSNIIVGEVLVFKHDNIVVVHRVVKIIEENGKLKFRTKGDNNNTEDNYDIDESQVVGVAKFRIPFLGLPSVWLTETLNR